MEIIKTFKQDVELDPDGDETMPMSSDSDVPFEMVVLDTALRVTANKFSRQLIRYFSINEWQLIWLRIRFLS